MICLSEVVLCLSEVVLCLSEVVLCLSEVVLCLSEVVLCLSELVLCMHFLLYVFYLSTKYQNIDGGFYSGDNSAFYAGVVKKYLHFTSNNYYNSIVFFSHGLQCYDLFLPNNTAILTYNVFIRNVL